MEENFKRIVAKFIMVAGMIILGVSFIAGIIYMNSNDITLGIIVWLIGGIGGMSLSCIGVIADHLADIKDILVYEDEDEEEGSEE